MSGVRTENVVRHDARKGTGELADENLVEQFLRGDEIDSDAAFRAIVERHGPMVLGICRLVLVQEADAEDAFQSTFLMLARKGALIRNRATLAAWLHEVAYRVAVKARLRILRRRFLERQSASMLPSQFVPDSQHEDAVWNELRPALHDEIRRLPEKYRVPVILSYLEGKSNKEVADLLQWPVGTVKGRLSRARALLRARLTRRGMALSAAFLLAALPHFHGDRNCGGIRPRWQSLVSPLRFLGIPLRASHRDLLPLKPSPEPGVRAMQYPGPLPNKGVTRASALGHIRVERVNHGRPSRSFSAG